MSDRSELWQMDFELDRLDFEIAHLRREQFAETRERLERLGIDVSRYRPPSLPTHYEQRCRSHPSGAELAMHDAQVRAHAPDEKGRPTFVRMFETSAISADGRNLEILCAPFNQPARVGDPPDFTPYDEEFVPGAFSEATKAPKRVLLDFEHQTAISGLLGHAAVLEERRDGLYGRFRVAEHPDGDKALALVRDGILSCASVMFKPLRTVRTKTGVVQRLKVHLDRVSLCRAGAYPQAKVLAVRSPAVISDDELMRPMPLDPDLVKRLKALGIRLSDRHR